MTVPFDFALAQANCEKCGFMHGAVSGLRTPVFRQTVHGGDGCLEWHCRNCGHAIVSQTKDAT
jgi:hypothetical protein